MEQHTEYEWRTLPGLWRRYQEAPRQLAFRATTQEEGRAWQRTLRATLRQLLGGFPAERCPLEPYVLERTEDDGYVRELVAFQTVPGEHVLVYVLVPPASAPPRPVIALHGHGGGGARHLAGIAHDEAEREHIRAHNYDYARQLALRGWTVFAPVQRGFAERQEPAPLNSGGDPLWSSSCYMQSVNAMLLGTTILGLRVWDVMRLLDYIETRSDVRQGSVGCVGLSGGGTTTLFATALEPRISCAVVSGFLNTFRDSLLAMEHCLCSFVPGILQYAEMEDIAGLIAPRPLLVESGTDDPIFPIEATERAYARVEQIYRCFDAADRLDKDIFKGGHQWSGAKAYTWLDRWLK
jgi:dienelactone hydrolase